MTKTEEEYAEDVTDLREAQRIIATLRRQIAELEPIPGEFFVFLNDKYTRMIHLLYQQNKLVYDQDNDLEIDDVFEQFVEDALEVRWDMARFDDESERPHRIQRRITPSA
jgi:hypothetical protein